MTRGFFASVACLLLALYFITYRATGEVIVVARNLDRLPQKIGAYTSQPVAMSRAVVDELNTDVYLYRNYRDGERVINLYVGYYGTQKGGRTGHNPNACYPSSGWAIVKEEKVSLPVRLAGTVRPVVITKLAVRKGEQELLVYHWYQSAASHILGDGIAMNLHRFRQLIRKNRNDGAFVRVSSAVGSSREQTEKALLGFIDLLVPLLEQYWPVEEEVSR